MKKKLLVVFISAIMGLQLVGCGVYGDYQGESEADNKATSIKDDKGKLVDNDTLANEVAEVYLDLKEAYLEVLQNKEMKEWNEEKTDAIKDLKKIKETVPSSNKDINKAIEDIESLVDKYQNSLDGKGADPTGIQNLESEIKELLFDD